MSASEGGSCYTIPMTPWNAYPVRATIHRHSDVIVYDRLLVQKPDNVNHRTRLRSHPRSFDPPCMKLMMMFLLLHTAIIILAAPAGSDTASRASTAGSSVIMTQGTYPDSSSIGSNRNFIGLASDTLESGSTASVLATAAGSVASMITAPTVTGPLLIGPSTATNDPEIPNTCILGTFNLIDETSLKVYMVGVILAASFAGMTLIIVSLLTCSMGSSCALGTLVYRRILCTHRVKA